MNSTPPGQRRKSSKSSVLTLFKLLLRTGLVLIILTGVAAIIFSSKLLGYATDKVIWSISQYSAPSGISQIRASYESVHLNLPRSIKWETVGISFSAKSSSMPFYGFSVRGKSMEFRLKNPFTGDGDLVFLNGTLRSKSRPKQRGEQQNYRPINLNGTVEMVKLPLTNAFRNPHESLKYAIRELSTLASGKNIGLPVEFRGVFQLEVSQKRYPCTLSVARRSGGYRLVINEADVRRIIATLPADEYSDDEIALIVDYPLRAPMLLQIKEYSRNRADELAQIDPDLPVDPYRHVLWSFLLTNTFGEKFAKRVTDAHEKNQTGVAGSDSFRDYQNNDVGRRYAVLGLTESVLASKVKSDPLVRR